MTDADAVLIGKAFVLFGQFAAAHPRAAGGLAFAFILFSAWGIIGANAPTDLLRAHGWRRSADFFDAGAVWGAFAFDVVSRIRKRLAARKETTT